MARSRKDILAIGYLGSYARGDWGPGSDVDLIVIVVGELPPLGERARGWDTTQLPVPADLLLYSEGEWRSHMTRSARWRATVEREVVWVAGEPPASVAVGS
jgi:predicted nucleotidyltransferase